jgi:hypothetical protein
MKPSVGIPREGTMKAIDDAAKVLAAINKKIDDIGEHPTLLKAREEAEVAVNGADALSPEQKKLLRDYVHAVLGLTLDQKKFPAVGSKTEE